MIHSELGRVYIRCGTIIWFCTKSADGIIIITFYKKIEFSKKRYKNTVTIDQNDKLL